MTSPATASSSPARNPASARRLLSASGATWFIAALIGQAIFALYIFLAYWVSAAKGDWAYWNKNLFTGIIAGDLLGNALMVMHLGLALIITASGPLQLIPSIRRHLPTFHRWNGLAYILIAMLISVGAILFLTIRPAFGGPINGLLQSFNGAVIIICAGLAWRAARRADFAVHRRWATRLFLVVSGVWFLRIMMISWAIPTGGAGLGAELDGPMGRFFMLGQTIIPLAIYQLYLVAEARSSAVLKYAVGGLLFGLTIVMMGGILGVTFAMWLPTIMP